MSQPPPPHGPFPPGPNYGQPWQPPKPRRPVSSLVIVLIVVASLVGGCSVLVVIGLVLGGGQTHATQQPLASGSPPATATTAAEELTIEVPDVRGMDGGAARDRLREAGFGVVVQDAVNGKTVIVASMWQVVEQSPPPGSMAKRSDAITLKLDRFPPTAEPEPTPEPQKEQPEKTEQPDETPPPKPDEPSDPPQKETDPNYGTCTKANAAGKGPYRRGQDPEYDWYQDRDGDGVVCEPR